MSALRLIGLALAPLALTLSLSACDLAPDAPAEDPPLANSALRGDYSLVDASGKAVTNSDFAGRYQLIYFGYTYCPNVCPFDLQRMMRGYETFAKANPDLAKDVQPIFITVDPERDTPEVIGQYTAVFSDELVGLTGTREQIDAVTANFFATATKIDAISEGGEYDMQHPTIGYLVDREGNPMAPISVMESAQTVAAELEKWVR